MSIFYDDGKSGTKSRAGELYTQKSIYRADVLQSAAKLNLTNVIDFNNFGEKLLYGRVNFDFVPVEIRYPKQFLADIPTDAKNDPKANLKVASFVVPMLNQMRDIFAKRRQGNELDQSHKYLSDIRVHKAYIDPNALYNTYLQRLSEQLQNQILKNVNQGGTNFTDIESFMNMLANVFDNLTLPLPFTKSAFVKSRLCPINCSGLVIEIADLNSANDQEKIKQFVNSKNWDLFVRTANACGFMIDASVPWRLVADVDPNEVRMLTNRMYGSASPRALFNKQYIPSHDRYFANFQKILYNLYNQLSITYISNNSNCADVRNFRENTQPQMKGPQLIEPEKYSWEEFYSSIPARDVYKLYFHLRFSEEESQFTDSEKYRIISDCLAIVEGGQGSRALRIFEKIINKTFDYTGSASYNLKRMNAQNETTPQMPSVSEIYSESALGNVGTDIAGVFGARTDPHRSFGYSPKPPAEEDESATYE
jgi:hypothetical protein